MSIPPPMSPVGPRVGPAPAELAELLLSTDTFADLLQGITQLSVRIIENARTCGLTLSQDGRVLTVAAADALAHLLDEHQYERDDGPCLQALRTARVVLADDLAAEDRWAGYPALAIEHGIRSVLATPLIIDGAAVGVLNVYGNAARVFGPEEQRIAELLAGQATIATTAAMRHYDEASLSENLRSALSSRSVIDQALGIVMVQRRCTSTEAFATLRRISQRRNAKLRVVAAELVDVTSRPDPA